MADTRSTVNPSTKTRDALRRAPSIRRAGSFPHSTGVKLTLPGLAQAVFRVQQDMASVVPKVERGGDGVAVVFDRDGELRPVGGDQGWVKFKNLSTDKTCDANSTTVAELADILGTLIEVLRKMGIVRV